ncbi:YqjF family protein [Kitasatospora sp. NPDC015120]|uniref:YqjF family protein n=1 Tax=Kitasatospora sp. NPDC015120 TaxID=3364023 RepID=UPI0036F49A98
MTRFVPRPRGSRADVVSYEPEQRVVFAALRSGWLSQTFVHWAYEPEQVQPLLPDGLEVDVFERAAWVSLTPFVMARVRPWGVPGDGRTFLETNLRTYVRRPDRSCGLWFLSLEVDCAAMLAARAVGVPYHLGRLGLSRQGGALAYTGRRNGEGVSYRLAVRPGARITSTALDIWLTSRWRAYTRRLGALWQTPVEHRPWPLREATLDSLHETLTGAAGLPAPRDEPLVRFSDGVEPVHLGLSRPASALAPGGRSSSATA